MSDSKVLLVEDDKTMLSLLKTLLSYEDFNIIPLEQFTNLDTILAVVQEEKPDLILLDVFLEQLDGFELLHHIRKLDTGKTVRVLMSSGMDVSERCLEEGADGFIQKPYMPEDLINTMRQALEG